jgi:hypothetical protein
MFANPREVLAFTHDGRQLRVPEPGSWVAFDCTDCGAHTEMPLDGTALMCNGCEKYAHIPAEWSDGR